MNVVDIGVISFGQGITPVVHLACIAQCKDVQVPCIDVGVDCAVWVAGRVAVNARWSVDIGTTAGAVHGADAELAALVASPGVGMSLAVQRRLKIVSGADGGEGDAG